MMMKRETPSDNVYKVSTMKDLHEILADALNQHEQRLMKRAT